MQTTRTTAWLAAWTALCALCAAQDLPPDAVLVGHWSFDEGEGQWVADRSPFGCDGILGTSVNADEADPTWEPQGHDGACLRFDGDTDRVTVSGSAPLAPARGLVVEAWVRQSARTPFARVLDKGSTFDMYIHENGTLSFRLLGAEAHGVRSTETIPLDTWVKLRAELFDGRMRLLVNDRVVAEREYTDPITDAGQDLRIGCAQNARPFCGLIDDVRYWNVGYRPPPALQRPEPDEHTVGLWHLDGEPVADAAGRQATAELLNGEFVLGRIGQALRLQGDGWVRVPASPSLDLTEQLTIDAWVKQQERGRYARIVEKSDWRWGAWIDRNGHVDFFFTTADGTGHHVLSRDVVPLRRWTHVRATFDGLEAAVFIDGKESVRTPLPPGQDLLATSTGDLYIGNRAQGDRGFVGMIDEVHIADVVRGERPPLVVTLSPLPGAGRWEVRASARGLAAPVARLEGRVNREADGAEIARLTIGELSRGVGAASLDIDPPPGRYALTVRAIGADDAELATARREVTVPDASVWRQARAGVTDAVLPPWTPLEVEEADDGVAVSCWGRRYELRGGGLLASLTSADAELLTGPCTLRAGEQTVQWDPPRVEAQGPAQVVLACDGRAGQMRLTMRATVEFDGMVRYDLTVTPPPTGGPAELALEIPLAAEHATLMHHTGNWFGDPTCAGAVPQEGWQEASDWYLWLGDEDRGLCWFAEDQHTWPLGDTPGLQVARDGDRTLLHVALAADALAGPRSFTWGLMATPVKPLPEDWRTWRFGSPSSRANIAVYWSLAGVSAWHSFPVPLDPDHYRRLGEEMHAAGRRIVPYTNFNMQSDRGEAWDYFGAEWYAHAGQGTAADVLRMGVVNMRCCPLTPSWTDFIAWQYQQFLQEYDWDGFYLDNSIPGRCNNPYHPADHHDRVLIFGARDLMKRFYAITKANDPRNVMVCHMSTRLCIPVLSFCDAYVDGEQYHWALDDFAGEYIALTPLARVRAELMGRNWGLIPLFLPEIKGSAELRRTRTRELLALLLPHGVRFWDGACDHETLNAALDELDAYGIAQARFVPYWEDEGPRVAQAQAIASAYARPGEAPLVIIANLADAERAIDVSFAGRTRSVTVPARDFRIIRLERE